MSSRPSLAEDATPDQFATAMVRCQCYAPTCSDLHACQLDGWCFGRDGQGFATARRCLSSLVEKECDVFIRSWLRIALDALDQHRFTQHRSFDALKFAAISKRIRAEYSAPVPTLNHGKR